MPSPFPGMDPFLENPHVWPSVHATLIAEIQAALNGQLRPKYVARTELRIYVSDQDDLGRRVMIPDVRVVETPDSWRFGSEQQPNEFAGIAIAEPVLATTLLDDEIEEAFLEIRDVATREVVTVIEVISPTNKVANSHGRDSYRRKRNEVMQSATHYVEIDLLRGGDSVITGDFVPKGDYLVHVSRVEQRPKGFVWPIQLPQRLPVIPIPLRSPDQDAKLDLQALLTTVYDRSGYDLDTDYTKEPNPPFPPKYREWADGLLRAKGQRT